MVMGRRGPSALIGKSLCVLPRQDKHGAEARGTDGALLHCRRPGKKGHTAAISQSSEGLLQCLPLR
eukprot:1097293-Amphidinium_carterae.1